MTEGSGDVEAAVDVTSDTFEAEVVARSRDVPVVVDFWAEWCGPCHALAPVLESEVESRGGAVALVKVDVDSNQDLAGRFQVMGIPAVKGFRDGRVVAEFVGALSAAGVSSFVDELLAPPRILAVADELRANGELSEVVAALDADDPEHALDVILEHVGDAAPEERGRLREVAVAIFDHLGHDDPLTIAYRRRLATALY
jgi:thioredoxin